MRSRVLASLILAAAASSALALDGTIGIHDPSTVYQSDGKWFAFGTGGNGIMSDDGWTWRSGAIRPNGGVAPDTIKIGDRYLVAYGGGYTMWTKSLDPNSPDFSFSQPIQISRGDGSELNSIDVSLMMAPDGKLWATIGSYVGYIQVFELDPKTGARIDNNYTNIAINCEASEMIFHDGYYYLFGNKMSCCAGASSGYNIRVGKSKSPKGPFIDNTGMDMIKGGGKLFVTSSGRWIGPGHYGLVKLDEGIEMVSMHYEADLDRGGASVLDVRPQVWKDGWPECHFNFKPGTYNIESARTGTSLEIAVDGVAVGGGGRGGARGGGGGRGGAPGAAPAAPGAMGPQAPERMMTVAAVGGEAPAGGERGGATMGGRGAGGGMGGGMGGGGGGMFGGSGRGPIPDQDVNQVSENWPKGNIDVRMANYMCQAQQKWTVAPAPNAGGYLGNPYFKITLAGTDRALAATADGELVSVPAYTGAPEQIWRMDLMTDGTYRIMPKAVPNSKDPMVLTVSGYGSVTLGKYDFKNDRQKWNFRNP